MSSQVVCVSFIISTSPNNNQNYRLLLDDDPWIQPPHNSLAYTQINAQAATDIQKRFVTNSLVTIKVTWKTSS